MAIGIPRFILTLAVPIFGYLAVLFLKRKKLISSDLKNLTSASSIENITASMKLQPDYSAVVQSSKTGEMQLKESESSSACNGIASLPKQGCRENGISSATNGKSSVTNGKSSATNGKSSATNEKSSASNEKSSATNGNSSAASGNSSTTNGNSSAKNGNSSATNGNSSATNGNSSATNGNSSATNGIASQNLTNGPCRVSYAAALKVNKNVNGATSVKIKSKENGTVGNVQSIKVDQNCNQNGLKKQTPRTELNTNGKSSSSTNSVSECANVVTVASTSNGVNQISKSRSKKKNKGRVPEKTNTCSIEPKSNGCAKDNNVHVQTDNEDSLPNAFSNLTVDDTSIQQTVLATKSQEMDLNSCLTNSTVENITSLDDISDTQTTDVDAEQSSNSENIVHIVEDLPIEAPKECDIVEQAIIAENHFTSSESGRSSSTLSESEEILQVDVDGHLTFPDGCVAAGGQDMLQSPVAAYCDSLGSADSGTGGSELQFGFDSQPCSMTYEFDLHADHCGYLIGKKGSHVNHIKEQTNALIWIRNSLSPFNSDKKIVSIIACNEASIDQALQLIRKRFPLSHYPDVTLERTSQFYVCPNSLKLTLPQGVLFQVVLSATANAAHFFVQLPTHPSYYALPPFTLAMQSMYTHCHSPILTTPRAGNIVVAPVHGGWYRAEVKEVFDDDGDEKTCKVKYLDYGGYQVVPISSLRQINVEFMKMPFQAIECYLANVTCNDENGFTDESKVAFETLAQGQVLSAFVDRIAEDGVPCLHLYKCIGSENTYINQALVEMGYGKWESPVDMLSEEPATSD